MIKNKFIAGMILPLGFIGMVLFSIFGPPVQPPSPEYVVYAILAVLISIAFVLMYFLSQAIFYRNDYQKWNDME